jgi:hypothetical protein
MCVQRIESQKFDKKGQKEKNFSCGSFVSPSKVANSSFLWQKTTTTTITKRC